MSTYSSLTAQNVSGSIIRPVAGTEVTISSLYTSSEPAPISYTYKWYKSTRLTAPVECEYGVIPADFVLYNANNDAIETSSINATMAGTYRCDVEAKNPDNMIVGQQVTFFSVLPPAIVLSEANTIGYAPLMVPPAPVDPVESEPSIPGLPANTVQPQAVPAGEVTSNIVMYLDASNPTSYAGEGATWVDLSGNNHHATVHGPNVWTSEDGGQFDYGDVDQTESYITLPHTAAQAVGDEWTLEFVMKPLVTSTAKYFGSIASTTDDNHMLLRVRDSQISAYRSYDNFDITDDEIIHFAITGSSNETGTYYKNGISQGSASHIKQINEVAAGGWILNHDQDSLGGGFQAHQNYRGAFIAVKLYDRKLTPAEIRQNSVALLTKYHPGNAPMGLNGEYYFGKFNVLEREINNEMNLASIDLYLYTTPGDTSPFYNIEDLEIYSEESGMIIPYSGGEFTHAVNGSNSSSTFFTNETGEFKAILRNNITTEDGLIIKQNIASIWVPHRSSTHHQFGLALQPFQYGYGLD